MISSSLFPTPSSYVAKDELHSSPMPPLGFEGNVKYWAQEPISLESCQSQEDLICTVMGILVPTVFVGVYLASAVLFFAPHLPWVAPIALSVDSALGSNLSYRFLPSNDLYYEDLIYTNWDLWFNVVVLRLVGGTWFWAFGCP